MISDGNKIKHDSAAFCSSFYDYFFCVELTYNFGRQNSGCQLKVGDLGLPLTS
jgi:hypothetical protein